MKWKKMGRIFVPDGSMEWARHTALTPTPLLVAAGTIRIYAGFRDDQGISRIGYVDLDADDPARVLRVSKEPVLDVGQAGAFDDNGVILGDIVACNDLLYMYYIGFQLVGKVKFLAFTGLAISSDGGNSFRRQSRAPVMDRSDSGLYIRAIHSVIIEDNVFKVWYAVGNDWQMISGKPYPKYNIHFQTSRDGIVFSGEGKTCIDVEGSEYRIGRPRVINMDGQYKMFYTKGTIKGDYLAGYGESADGVNWTRKDDELGIALSESGWDSKSLSYPALLNYRDRVYMFYNGNDMGKTGFGFAVLESW